MCWSLSSFYYPKKGHGLSLKKRGKMACQRSITHSEGERKDGVPKKHNPKKNRHMKVHEKKEEIVMLSK